MSSHHSSCALPLTRQQGAVVKTLLLTVTALALLIAAWVVVLETMIRPESLTMSAPSLSTRLMYWLLPPLALILAVLGGRGYYAHAQERKAQACQKAQQEADAQRQRLLATFA